MSDTTNLEQMIMDLTDSVNRIEVRVGSIESEIGSMKSEIGSMKSEIGSMKSEIGSMKSEIGSMKSEMGSMKSEMGSMKSEMHTGFRRLEEIALDTRDEMRTENIATRTLLNQAFTHISDQLGRDGDRDFVPKYPRVPR
jgi:chromosome segregation ATPase